jgi:maltose alpha-D-glucosyltransferase/alpha-amylase
MADNAVVTMEKSVLHFTANQSLKKHLSQGEVKSRVHFGRQNNTSITYNNSFFLKMYRKVDKEINPDTELSKYLTEEAAFPYTPAYIGSIEWMLEKNTVTIGMMQVMVENHGDGQTYMLERLNNYIERILARGGRAYYPEEQGQRLTDPISYEALPQELQTLLGAHATDESHLLGKRTAQLHAALTLNTTKEDFTPEDFSLHYQRSLYSSMQSLVRETYQSIEKNTATLPAEIAHELKTLVNRKDDILRELKKIYQKKLDASKTRIHGNLHLQQILLTGKDIAIHDFGGNPHRNYSERRLKRSPLRDVASMIRSFYYTAYKAFFSTGQVPKNEIPELLPFAPVWARYMSSFFLDAYLEKAKQSSFIPGVKDDLDIMLRSYLLEGALHDLNYELNNRPDYISVPLSLIRSLMNEDKPVLKKILPARQEG